MADKKKNYRSKKNKSKLKVMDRILHLKRSAFQKTRAVTGLLSAVLQKGFNKLRAMPRVFKILSIYAFTVLLALGIFYWRLTGLRVEQSPQAEPSFDWTVYLPDDQSDSTNDTPGDLEKEGAVSSGSEEPEADEREESVATEPVFIKGEWPVRGELFYGFHETVIQQGLGYPLYYASKGIAIEAEKGTETLAPWDGKVVKVMDLDKPHGKSVMIEHDNGLVSYYGALQEVVVEVDDRISRGQPLGLVGSGFESEPDYLYLEILKDGRVVNPLDYLLPE